MGDQNTRVLLANKDEEELAELARVVEAADHEVVELAITASAVGDAVVQHRPDLAMVLIEDDEAHALQLVVEIRSFAAIPVVLVAREVNDGMLTAAADHSIEVLHLPGTVETVAKVIDVAITRYRKLARLEQRVGDIDGMLERRTTIEQAKGILMERHGIDANEAFVKIRAHARENQIRVVDVAASVITARSLLDPSTGDADGRTGR